MAEIKIEKKSPVWPWILLALLVLAGILYFVMGDDNDDDLNDDDDATTEQVLEENVPVEENNADQMYSGEYDSAIASYTDYLGNTEKMGIDHEYSNGALMLLIDAVSAKADVLDIDLDADLAQARENANAITTDPYEVNHADLIKNSGKIITRALTTLQTAKYPNLTEEVSMVEKNVMAITKEEHTLDQKGDVNRFFKSAEDLLIKMN